MHRQGVLRYGSLLVTDVAEALYSGVPSHSIPVIPVSPVAIFCSS